jgi:hypothetical protein
VINLNGRVPHSRTVPMPKPLRKAMEDAFSTSFRDLKLHRVESASGFANTTDVLACATLDGIYISSALLDMPGPMAEKILAHELAHVCQKRLGVKRGPAMRWASPAELEIEATLAADTIARGEKYLPVLCDSSPEPRPWGVAGHFYTVYLISVASGLDPEIAFRNALYAQMPDDLPVGDLAFGLALHAFGDSYAHCTMDNEEILYRAPFGHAVEAVKWQNGWFRDPHAPDSSRNGSGRRIAGANFINGTSGCAAAQKMRL